MHHFVDPGHPFAERARQHRAVHPRLQGGGSATGGRDGGCHFLYANLAHAQTKADILELLATQFFFPAHFGKNFDALYDCLTDPIHKAGPQPGFVLVLDQIPTTPKFDKEVREQLLDSGGR